MTRLTYTDWLSNYAGNSIAQCLPLMNDASFRRYFRVYSNDASAKPLILMDAPPPHEKLAPFVHIAQEFRRNDILVPEIIFADIEQGYALLSDLGNTTLQHVLTKENAIHWYTQTFAPLHAIQSCHTIPNLTLPPFSPAFMQQQYQETERWFFSTHLNYQLSADERHILDECYTHWLNNITQQPQVCVHRDYHCRNLMIIDDTSMNTPPLKQKSPSTLPFQGGKSLWQNDGAIGVLDFQDAMIGPITYDLVSLLRDCYVTWPEDLIEECVATFYEQLQQRKQLNRTTSLQQFLQWFDYTGLHRHYRILGNFARLHHRDHKPAYLNSIPSVFAYIQRISHKYPVFTKLHDFFEKKIKSKLSAHHTMKKEQH